jgi:hypothetical protein
MDPTGSLYTDASRTTQVTTLGNRIRSFTNLVTGQPHGAASSDAKSPLWNEFTVNGRAVRGAVFDGSDDCLQVSGFDMSNTNTVCAIAGVRKLSDVTDGIIVEHTSIASSTAGGFNIGGPSTLIMPRSYGFLARTTSRGGVGVNGIPAPSSNNLSFTVDTSLVNLSDQIKVMVDGQSRNDFLFEGPLPSGNFANSTLNIGGRNNSATLPFNGAISYLFICGAIPPDSILTKIYRGLSPQIGVSV